MNFESFRNARIIRSAWLERDGRRLDCNPYMSGALEASDALDRLSVPKVQLKAVTSRIFHAGREARVWVQSEEFGIPFLGSSDIQSADFTSLPFMSKKQVRHHPAFTLGAKWTLITRSGTIGRMAFVRSDMDGMACSEHVLRVVPNESIISPGFLYAFLSSKYGVPLVVSGTYGAIIQHIEPEHIAKLYLPRFGQAFEEHVSKLVETAAAHRTMASQKRAAAIQEITRLLNWTGLKHLKSCRTVSSTAMQSRMDAFYHSVPVAKGNKCLASMSGQRLGELVERVFEPNRGPRLKVEDADFGIPFLSSSAVFDVHPKGEYLISKSRTADVTSLLVTSRDVLIPRSGQVGGIIGRAVLPLAENVGNAASEHLVRIRCHSEDDAAYLWAVFATEPGYWAVVGTAYGTSIPSLDSTLIADLFVPWLRAKDRKHIALLAREAVKAQGLGNQYETEAVRMVEERISEGR
jgi:type I restriction enzyme S subunit